MDSAWFGFLRPLSPGSPRQRILTEHTTRPAAPICDNNKLPPHLNPRIRRSANQGPKHGGNLAHTQRRRRDATSLRACLPAQPAHQDREHSGSSAHTQRRPLYSTPSCVFLRADPADQSPEHRGSLARTQRRPHSAKPHQASLPARPTHQDRKYGGSLAHSQRRHHSPTPQRTYLSAHPTHQDPKHGDDIAHLQHEPERAVRHTYPRDGSVTDNDPLRKPGEGVPRRSRVRPGQDRREGTADDPHGKGGPEAIPTGPAPHTPG